MEFEYSYPKLKYGLNPPAIYKISFDTGHFYIGSSSRVKTRFVIWRTNFKRDDFSSRAMAAVLPTVRKISFEIIEYLEKGTDTLARETYYLKQNEGNQFSLNMRLNAIDNSEPNKLLCPKKKVYQKKGRFVRPEGYITTISKMAKPINQYTLQGVLISTHPSKNEAARKSNINGRDLDAVLKGRRKTAKGFIFKYA